MKYFTPALLLVMAFSGLAPGSAAAASPQSMKPDATHPFVMQQAAGGGAAPPTGSPHPFAGPSQRPAVAGGGGQRREVFGFALASSLGDATVGYPTWNFSLLSTV